MSFRAKRRNLSLPPPCTDPVLMRLSATRDGGKALDVELLLLRARSGPVTSSNRLRHPLRGPLPSRPLPPVTESRIPPVPMQGCEPYFFIFLMIMRIMTARAAKARIISRERQIITTVSPGTPKHKRMTASTSTNTITVIQNAGNMSLVSMTH